MSDFKQPRPAFMQFKGTDICLDLHCPACHYDNHYDGYFAYVVECAKCKARWELDCNVGFRRTDKEVPISGPRCEYDEGDDPEKADTHNCTPECVDGYFSEPQGEKP